MIPSSKLQSISARMTLLAISSQIKPGRIIIQEGDKNVDVWGIKLSRLCKIYQARKVNMAH